MEKEFLIKTSHSVTLNVTGGKIDSFREQEETTGTVRVYENGCIGVAGCLGTPDEKALTEKATEALSLNIPYPCKLEGATEQEDLHEEEIIPVPALIPTMQAFLVRLGETCPRFAFSNKISLNYTRTEYRNSLGRHLTSSGRDVSVQLLVQNRGSGNLFDTAFMYEGNSFDPDALLSQFKNEYDAYYKPADIEPGRYPVVMDASEALGTFIRHFIAEMYVSGASLLSGKLGQKVFSEKLSLRSDMNPATHPGACFFDDEGCIAPDFRPTLIDKGTLTGLITTKKSSDKFGLSNLGTASAAYDGVPGLGFNRFYADSTAKTLSELVPGKAIYVIMASGGDTTPDGHFATPVQMSYLLENGKFVGRLPELNISGNFYDLLGKDYIGAVRGDPHPDSMLCAVTMDVKK
ncbi:MAG: metallopeptidase TldD-related protein [Eubacteriales bacterium]